MGRPPCLRGLLLPLEDLSPSFSLSLASFFSMKPLGTCIPASVAIAERFSEEMFLAFMSCSTILNQGLLSPKSGLPPSWWCLCPCPFCSPSANLALMKSRGILSPAETEYEWISSAETLDDWNKFLISLTHFLPLWPGPPAPLQPCPPNLPGPLR